MIKIDSVSKEYVMGDNKLLALNNVNISISKYFLIIFEYLTIALKITYNLVYFKLTKLIIFLISIYGIIFKILKLDLLRLQKSDTTYWLEIEQLKPDRLKKQY